MLHLYIWGKMLQVEDPICFQMARFFFHQPDGSMNHGSLLHHGTVMTSPKEALELRDEIIHLANEVSTLPVWQGSIAWGWSCSLPGKSRVITCNFVDKGYNSVYI